MTGSTGYGVVASVASGYPCLSDSDCFTMTDSCCLMKGSNAAPNEVYQFYCMPAGVAGAPMPTTPVIQYASYASGTLMTGTASDPATYSTTCSTRTMAANSEYLKYTSLLSATLLGIS